MARYMTQVLFNTCSIVAAKCHYDDEVELISELVGSYQGAYMDDTELLNDIEDAAKKVLELVRKAVPDRDLHPVFIHLRVLAENYELDGRKRKRKILGGTFFNKERRYNRGRVKECVRDVLVYHTGSMTGFFPLYDWIFQLRVD